MLLDLLATRIQYKSYRTVKSSCAGATFKMERRNKAWSCTQMYSKIIIKGMVCKWMLIVCNNSTNNFVLVSLSCVIYCNAGLATCAFRYDNKTHSNIAEWRSQLLSVLHDVWSAPFHSSLSVKVILLITRKGGSIDVLPSLLIENGFYITCLWCDANYDEAEVSVGCVGWVVDCKGVDV